MKKQYDRLVPIDSLFIQIDNEQKFAVEEGENLLLQQLVSIGKHEHLKTNAYSQQI